MQASNPFMITMPSVFDSMGQGYAQQAAIRDDQQRQAAMLAQAEAQQRMAQEAYELSRNPNATAHDYAAFMMRNPAMSDNAKQAFELMSPEQKANQLAETGQVYSALVSGRPDVAESLLTKSRLAAENAGDAKRVAEYDAALAQLKADPAMLETVTGATLTSLQGADKYSENFGRLLEQKKQRLTMGADVLGATADAQTKATEAAYRGARLEQDLAQGAQKMIIDQERLNLDAARLGLDQAKLAADTQAALAKSERELGALDVEARKQVDAAAVSSAQSKSIADKALGLAAEFDQNPDAFAGRIINNDSAQSELARMAQSLATKAELSEFKKVASGSMSDTDIALALGGIPSKNANSKTWANYLRAMGQAARVTENMEDAKVGWLSANSGSSGDAPRDIVVRGVAVPKGTSLAEFQQLYVKNRNAAPQASSGERPYMRYGQGR